MNLLQNKRKRKDSSLPSSQFFPSYNSSNYFQFNTHSKMMNNSKKIFLMKEHFRKNLIYKGNNNKNNYNETFENNIDEINFNLNDNLLIEKYFKNERLKLFFIPSKFQIESYMNLEEFKNNNFVQVPHTFEENSNCINDNNKVKIEQNLKNDRDEINKNIIFNNEKINLLNNINNINNTKKQTHFSIKKEAKLIKNSPAIFQKNEKYNIPNLPPNGIGIFKTKNISDINQKKRLDGPNSSNNNLIESSKPFQTFNAKYFIKNNQISDKSKSNQAKIFHIEKIFNKSEYRDANEKESCSEDKNLKNRFKISLKKIKQIYTNSCLKIYLYHNDTLSFSENKLNDELYLNKIIQQVYDIIKSKKINSSKMNEILQVNDDDKYRKHYFMFTSEAKQFCLDLINIKKLSFDIVMKMCKVPRKSLRRWSHVGCNRKKGCGRKTRNPEMENKLVEWYREEIGGGANVSAKMIRDKAVEISGDKDFLASKGWLEKFKKKFGIRIATHKNKNFKKIITFKEKLDKIDNLNENEDDIKCQNEEGLFSEKKNSEPEIEEKEEKKYGGKSTGNEEDKIANEIENEEEDENEQGENENESNNDNEENEDINENENGLNININNYDENNKNDETKIKIEKDINLKKPMFWKTKIDKRNNKKFNVFRLKTIC